MLHIHEFTRTLPCHAPLPLTALPLIYQREHLFPYSSYGDTETTPVPRNFRMVCLENEFLRVEVAPELGGRVYRLFDRRIGRDVVFSNPVVKSVRILPIWAFISGGIEFNFPIAHSPTSIAEVGCATGRIGNYGFIRIGEREARTGMEWVVELGLAKAARRSCSGPRFATRRAPPTRGCRGQSPRCRRPSGPSSSTRRTACSCTPSASSRPTGRATGSSGIGTHGR